MILLTNNWKPVREKKDPTIPLKTNKRKRVKESISKPVCSHVPNWSLAKGIAR